MVYTYALISILTRSLRRSQHLRSYAVGLEYTIVAVTCSLL